MPGILALHGGGEFLPGDEDFLLACLEAARPAARVRAAACIPARSGDAAADGGDDPGTVRVGIVPAAAAGERPDLAAANGVEALRRVASRAGVPIRAEPVMVIDAASAASATVAGRLAGLDLVHLPGGNPGRILEVLDGSAAWRAILAALARGGVLAGASAGAMVLADWTWTPGGWRRGLGLVPGLVVVPHAERVGAGGLAGTFGAGVPPVVEPIGRLGLDEQTGVISETGRGGRRRWRVVGRGFMHWSPSSATPPSSARAPSLVDLAG